MGIISAPDTNDPGHPLIDAAKLKEYLT